VKNVDHLGLRMIIPIEETIVPLPNVNEFIGELITLA
jgi:hypothetical protein